MSFGEKLELHYYLNNGSHSMDALVRNKCEAEILAKFKRSRPYCHYQSI